MEINLDGNNLLRMLALHRIAQLVGDNDDDNQARIREVHSDEEQEPSRRQSESQHSNIEQLLNQSALISSYMDEGKHEEAYGLVKKQYKQGANTYFLRVLINYYVVLMQTNRPEKAFKIEKEIVSILQNTIDCSPSDAQVYAVKLYEKSKYFETILFSHIAQEFCRTETDAAEKINTLQRVSLFTKLAVQKLIEQRKISKLLVKKHIIPEMKKSSLYISNTVNVDRKKSCIVQAVCMHHLETTQLVIGDSSGREATETESVAMMESVLGKDVEKYHVYSDTLNNLGQTYLSQDRPQDALRVLTKAVNAKKKAEDYDNPAEKLKDLQTCENSLRTVQRRLNITTF